MSDKTSTSLRLKRGRYTAIAGKYYRTPKEIWNFRTAARVGSPESIARDFVVANAALFGLEDGVSELAVQRVIRSLSATHVIFKQVHDRYRVHRGYVTVHMDRSGRGYLSKRVRKHDLQFSLRSHEHGFEEVMVYYHVDSALRYLAQLGYNGARAIFREPVKANVNGTRDDNSWYSPVDRMLTFGTGDIDDAEDAETILHELGSCDPGCNLSRLR